MTVEWGVDLVLQGGRDAQDLVSRNVAISNVNFSHRLSLSLFEGLPGLGDCLQRLRNHLKGQGKGKAGAASSSDQELQALHISSSSPRRVFLDASASSIISEHEFTQVNWQ